MRPRGGKRSRNWVLHSKSIAGMSKGTLANKPGNECSENDRLNRVCKGTQGEKWPEKWIGTICHDHSRSWPCTL